MPKKRRAAASSMSPTQKCGWDLTSLPAAMDGKQPEPATSRSRAA